MNDVNWYEHEMKHIGYSDYRTKIRNEYKNDKVIIFLKHKPWMIRVEINQYFHSS